MVVAAAAAAAAVYDDSTESAGGGMTAVAAAISQMEDAVAAPQRGGERRQRPREEVRGHKLVLRAIAKKVFLTNRPPRWLALYGYLQFSWEEKLVAPLIAHLML